MTQHRACFNCKGIMTSEEMSVNTNTLEGLCNRCKAEIQTDYDCNTKELQKEVTNGFNQEHSGDSGSGDSVGEYPNQDIPSAGQE